MSSLLVRGATVRYGSGRKSVLAVDGVDLELPAGTTLGLVGESGSGKSTLGRAVVGLLPLAAGRVTFDGEELSARSRRDMQLVFQDPFASLDPRMSVGESIGEGLARGGSRDERRQRIDHLLEQVGLDADAARVLPRDLSGGQRQRVAIARALAAEPSLLVADEITSALDVSVQGAILNLIRDLQRTNGFSLLFISHNLAVVRYLADTIAVMYCGQVVEIAPTERLLADPQHPYTRSLLETIPSLESTVAPRLSGMDVAGIAEADPADPIHPPSGCRFHPRCPIGPLAYPERRICETEDPRADAAGRLHHASCFFTPTTPTTTFD